MRAPLSARGTMVLGCVIFLSTGLTTAVLSPALTTLAERTGASVAALGAIFSALFVGTLITQLVIGPLNERLGYRQTIFGGLLLVAVGMAAVTQLRALWPLLAAALVAGLGGGALISGVNVLIAQLFAARAAAALNLVNVFFGVGAVLGPALAGLSFQQLGTPLPAIWCGVAALLLTLPFALRLAQPTPLAAAARGAAARSSALWRPQLWLLGLLALLYVGAETAIASWTPRYLQRSGLDAASAAFGVAGFWLALTVGRLLGSAIGTRLPARTLLLLASGGGALGGGLLWALGSPAGIIAAVMVCGLAFGPIYPTALALTVARYREQASTATSVFMVLGSVGGVLLPWVLGQVLERSGPPLFVTLIAAVTLLILLLAWASTPQATPPSGSSGV